MSGRKLVDPLMTRPTLMNGRGDVGQPGEDVGMTDTGRSLRSFQTEVQDFAIERDWVQFHDPKSLILALVGAVGELAELFQWVPASDAAAVFSAGSKLDRASEEIADVLIYLLGLGNVLGIDVLDAAEAKLDEARVRFPVAEVSGTAPSKE